MLTLKNYCFVTTTTTVSLGSTYIIGVRKPDPAIYQLALSGMGGVSPGRAVFLDDVEQNVLSSRDLGIHAIQVPDDPEAAIRELRELLKLTQ